MAIMQRFGDATGLRINVSKSTAAPIRCSQINLDEVLQSFTGAVYPSLSPILGFLSQWDD
jgi:hypothetical protein